MLGSDIYRFDVIGGVREQAETNLEYAVKDSVCINRELEKRCMKSEKDSKVT